MRKRLKQKRKFKKYLKNIPFLPVLKPLILITMVICLLLIPIPYLITKITPNDSSQNSSPEKKRLNLNWQKFLTRYKYTEHPVKKQIP